MAQGTDAFQGTAIDACKIAEDILQGVESTVDQQGSEVTRDGARAELVQARLAMERVDVALTEASEIRSAGTRIMAYVAVAAHCAQHPTVESVEIRRALALVRRER